MKQIAHNKITPLTSEQLDCLQSVFINLSHAQLVWLSGYLWGLTNTNYSNSEAVHISSELQKKNIDTIQKITLISASQTGNARQLAEQLRDELLQSNLDVILFNAADYKFKKIAHVKLLIFITSTYGDGEPPEEAIALYKYLFSQKAPRMENTYFSVFSLGDRSYKHFAKAGRDFDNRLEELGAHRLYDRIDADLHFQEAANIWCKKIVSLCKEKIINISLPTQENQTNITTQVNYTAYNQEAPLIAYLSIRQKITSRSSLKDVHHLEIDISGSDLYYQPGDSLGIWYENDPNLINELLELLSLTGNISVQIKGKSMFLNEVLQKHYELTQNTPIVVQNIAAVSQNETLLKLCSNLERLRKFVETTPIIEMIRDIPITLTSQELLQVLRPMKPRFYSISSAQSEVGEEVHITVNVVRYKIDGRDRTGGASGYLVDRLKENEKIRIFVKPNDNFRLPKNPNVPIVMIGAGTGIAPFRAFMQHRALDGNISGKNWLFFGNLRFIDDFLYQIEWQNYTKDGLLNNISTAWSRDQDYKIYVQDKLLENGIELWSWIKEGAHIYVCGDAKYMAHDVDKSLVMITSQHGGMTLESANEFWDEMRIQHRYQRDIY